MAPFNPPVPAQADPRYYLHLPHAAQEPHLVSSSAESMKTMGNVIESGAKVAAHVTDSMAEQAGKDDQEKIRSDEINKREQQLLSIEGQQEDAKKNTSFVDVPFAGGAVGTGQGSSLFEPRPSEAYAQAADDINRGIGDQKLFQGLKESGKASDTYYYMRSNQSMKTNRMNWTFPLRDAYDKGVAKVLGGDPANLEYHSLLRDINDAVSANKSKDSRDREDFLRLWRENATDSPNFLNVQKYVMGGGDLQQAWTHLGPLLTENNKLRIDDNIRKNRRMVKEDTDDQKMRDGEAAAEAIQNKWLHEHQMENGDSFSDLQKFNQEYRMGKYGNKPLDPEMAQILEQRASALANGHESELRAHLSGMGLKAEQVEALVTKRSTPFKQLVAQYGNKEEGLLYGASRLAPNIQAMAEYKLWDQPGKIHNYFELVAGLKGRFGDTIGKELVDQMAYPEMDKALNELLKSRDYDRRSLMMGQPMTLKQLVENVGKDTAKIPNVSPGAPNPYTGKQLDYVFKIFDGKTGFTSDKISPEDKNAWAGALFGPGNTDVFSLIDKDVYNDNGHLKAPGRESFFDRATKEPVAAEILKTQHGKDYLNFVQREAVQNILPPHLSELAAIPEATVQSMGGTSTQKGPHSFQYSTSSSGAHPPSLTLIVNGKPFTPDQGGGVSLPPASGGSLDLGLSRKDVNYRQNVSAYNHVQSINKVLEGIYNVAKAGGSTDVDGTVAQAIVDAAHKAKITDDSRLVRPIISAMRAARTAPTPPPEGKPD